MYKHVPACTNRVNLVPAGTGTYQFIPVRTNLLVFVVQDSRWCSCNWSCNGCNYMHYMVVTSITVLLHPGCNSCNYIHYMTNYMLPKVLMTSMMSEALASWLRNCTQAHGVSLPELKMSTCLKLHLKPSVQMYCQMRHLAVHCSWYTL